LSTSEEGVLLGYLHGSEIPTGWFGRAVRDVIETRRQKGRDYDDPQDEFRSFREVASFFGHDPSDSALHDLLEKLARLRSLRRDGRTPANETMRDTYKDIAAYGLLMYAMWLEENDQTPDASDPADAGA
jgi:hypothetical protein